MEYTCTKDDTIKTGISIDTVNESKLNAQDTFKDSASIHLNKCMVTGVLFNPTSMKARIDRTVVVITQLHVINCYPLTPTFLPKKPAIIEPNIGNIIKARYIINSLLLYFLLIYKMLLIYLIL